MSWMQRFHLCWFLALLGCTAPNYHAVPPADPINQSRRVTSGFSEQAVVRDQHLGQLRTEARYLEELMVRAEQERLDACRAGEANQAGSQGYQRCQVKDQLYEQRKTEAANARRRYLQALSGSGSSSW